jgi:hypothetical protein
MFFANGLARSLSGLTASHPPLAERIRRIEPSFRGEFPRVDPAQAAAEATASFAAAPAGPRAPAAAPAASMVASVGAPSAAHVAYAHRLLESLPPAVYSAAHSSDEAQTLLYALLASGDAAARDAQRSILAESGGIILDERVVALEAAIRPLGESVRLPLLDLLLPALRALPAERRETVQRTAEQLVRADGRVDMFELALLHVLDRQLGEGRNAAAAGSTHTRSIGALRDEAALVLSAVAWSGAGTEAEAANAFAAGLDALRLSGPAPRLAPAASIDAATINRSLERLRGAAAAARRQFLEACTMTVAHDGRVQTAEGELLRAVAEALDCPMPPALSGGGTPVGTS